MPPYRMLYLCSRATECEPEGCERPTAGSKEAAAHNSRSKVLEMLIAMLRVLEMVAVALISIKAQEILVLVESTDIPDSDSRNSSAD